MWLATIYKIPDPMISKLKEIFKWRELIFNLALRDLKAKYRDVMECRYIKNLLKVDKVVSIFKHGR